MPRRLLSFILTILLFGWTWPAPAVGEGVTPMVAFGNGHTLVLKADGTVWSWGDGSAGQMGNGIVQPYTEPFLKPVQADISDVKFIAGGNSNAYAIKKDGTLWAWGFNGNGELGVGDKIDRSRPTQVPGLTDIIQVAGTNGGFAACVKADGTVYAWGYNGKGQLGNGTTTESTSPVQSSAAGFSDIKQLDVGADHVVARKADGTVWTWGSNSAKQCGRAGYSYYTTPGQVTTAGVENIIQVKTGSAHSVALKNDGTVWTWGWNKYGQLGKGYVLTGDDGEYLNARSYYPAQVDGLAEIANIDAGFYQTMIQKSNGTIWFVGYNYSGQFGDGNALRFIPYATEEFRQTLISGPFLQMDTYVSNTGFVKTDGTVWICGGNTRNEVGTGAVIPAYVDIPYRVLRLNLIADIIIPGDVDGSDEVTLGDALVVFQALTGISPAASIRLSADVNGDNQIGLAEAIYILQKVAGVRP